MAACHHASTSLPPSSDDMHFTPLNIPWGIASSVSVPEPRVVTRVYNNVYFLVDLISAKLLPANILNKESSATLSQPNLNAFAALPHVVRASLRTILQSLFTSTDKLVKAKISQYAHPVSTVKLHLPVLVGDFSDFSTSVSHVLNAGEAVLNQRTLPPGFPYFPVGYAGRSSSVVVSGTPVKRPAGFTRDRANGTVCFGPTQALDFELEVAAIVSKPTVIGEKVSIADADSHIFGLVLVNDWSARDIQGLEMTPLGPFNGKSFGTTMSPWVVTLEALKPFETAGTSIIPSTEDLKTANLKELPQRASYLKDPKQKPHYDVNLQVDLTVPRVSSATSNYVDTRSNTTTLCRSNLSSIYWSIRDMVAHQTISGCPLRSGDVLATGTISGPNEGSFGCLLETTRGGKMPLKLSDGSERRYLNDGDEVLMTGWAGTLGEDDCVGFGICGGVVYS